MISKGSYDLESGIWKTISDEAKNLIKQLMEVDPEQRLSAKSALQHPWIIH
jgi:calcium-dependent protein kinase